MSSASAIVLQDVVKRFKPNISDSAGTKVSKLVCVCVGVVSLLLVVAARYLGSGLLTVMTLTFNLET